MWTARKRMRRRDRSLRRPPRNSINSLMLRKTKINRVRRTRRRGEKWVKRKINEHT
jgi:hypothetical protein